MTKQSGNALTDSPEEAGWVTAKTLAEARGQATSDYQTYLEKEWITTMRTARPVKVNETEVSKLVTK